MKTKILAITLAALALAGTAEAQWFSPTPLVDQSQKTGLSASMQTLVFFGALAIVVPTFVYCLEKGIKWVIKKSPENRIYDLCKAGDADGLENYVTTLGKDGMNRMWEDALSDEPFCITPLDNLFFGLRSENTYLTKSYLEQYPAVQGILKNNPRYGCTFHTEETPNEDLRCRMLKILFRVLPLDKKTRLLKEHFPFAICHISPKTVRTVIELLEHDTFSIRQLLAGKNASKVKYDKQDPKKWFSEIEKLPIDPYEEVRCANELLERWTGWAKTENLPGERMLAQRLVKPLQDIVSLLERFVPGTELKKRLAQQAKNGRLHDVEFVW